MTNIALVVLDTVRNDAFQEYFSWMPGVYFPNAWSTSHRTPPVHASLFTGQYGSEVGVVPDSDSLSCDRPVLAELLRDEGYRTRGYSANPYVSSQFNFDRGFTDFHTTWKLDLLSTDLFDWEEFATNHKSDGVSRYLRGILECIQSDTNTTSSIRRGIEIKLRDLGFDVGPKDDGATEIEAFVEDTSFGTDEFLFINLMEAHEPYTSPNTDGDPQINLPTTVELTFRNHNYDAKSVQDTYEDAVSYLSGVYRRIFSSLTSSFDIVITCGDHGELFDKRGMWGHFHGVDPELTNVPLHVYQGESGRTEQTQTVSLLDIYTTVLGLADVNQSLGRGKNILTEQPEVDSRLVECRGISEKRVDQIRYDTEATKKTKAYEDNLYGAVIPPEIYAYEHIDGFEVCGNMLREEAQATVESLVTDLDIKQPIADSVGSNVEIRLEDLGYV